MSRTVAIVTLTLTAVMAFLLGITTGNLRTPVSPAPVADLEPPPAPEPRVAEAVRTRPSPAGVPAPAFIATGMVNFADVAESLNPAVVNIEATTRGASRRRRNSVRM